MKKIRYSRRLLAASSLIAGLGVVAIGATTALAAQPADQGHLSGLVEAIAQRFNVSETDVQQVIDTQMEQERAQREAQQQTRFTQAIADGKITQAQADAITAKRAEDKAFFASLSSLDETARQNAIKAHQEEMKTWTKENGIKPPFDHMMGPRGGHHGGPNDGQGHKGFGPDDGPDSGTDSGPDTEETQP